MPPAWRTKAQGMMAELSGISSQTAPLTSKPPVLDPTSTIELLSTKLYIPRPRANQVHRPLLTERLNTGLDKKLTLIAAPAGFGKTTLLSEWIPQSPQCVTWLSLDEEDNDLTRFWTYFIASLQQLRPDLGESTLRLLQSPQAPSITSILTALINDISAFPDRFSSVLEDYHVIEAQPVHEALIFLLAHLPSNMHLVMTTRADPPLPLARLRARGKLTELRANDLRFTAEEAAAFLARTMGLNLTTEEITVLEKRTEGWIAGLQIAALSMQNHHDIPGFIQAFSGSHRHILGYLAEEVLNQRPKGTLNFLLQTSILDRLCAPLCEAVTGEPGGQEILENLEHANLFITPLDDKGVWYRYHHLFAEVLQARMLRTQRERLPELHRRAGSWYACQGMIEDGVRHALAGADFEQAAALIESAAGNLLRGGSSAKLIQWLDAMPGELVLANPRLCMARAWTYHWGPALSLEGAEAWAQRALHAGPANEPPDADLAGEAAALQAMIAATRSEAARSRELSRQALEHLPLDSPWRSAVVFCLGTAHFTSGDMAAAAQALGEALQLSQADGSRYIQLNAGSFLADLQVWQGHLGQAMTTYQQVLNWTEPGLPQKGGLMAYAGQAHILCEQNQLEAALTLVQSGVKQLDQVGGAWAALVLYRVLARLHQAHGRWAEALEVLNRAYQIGQKGQVSLVMKLAAALRARMQLAQGDLAAAEAWAASSRLSPDDPETSQPGLRETEYLSLAAVLSAQGKYDEALSLLQRLIQSAEAEGLTGSVIAMLVLQSLIFQSQGSTLRAGKCLERALRLAEPEGYLRIFLDEGEPMRVLLSDLKSNFVQGTGKLGDSSASRLKKYIGRLLAAFSLPAPAAEQKPAIGIEPLSERELEILRLIAEGLTNQEIALKLVIALSTVKTHINHLYSKLGVQGRIQAITVARDINLLST